MQDRRKAIYPGKYRKQELLMVLAVAISIYSIIPH